MPVAKSYQTLEKLTEPYNVKGRAYVDVRTAKGATKRVRWYSDAEYKKLYPDAAVEGEVKRIKNLKDILGFSTGSITVFYGNTYEIKDWFVEQKARYNQHFGWYMADGMTYQEPLPAGVQTHVVNWSDVSIDNDNLKSNEEIKGYMDSFVYPEDQSQFIGTIGQRIEVEVTVVKNISVEGYYGLNHIHTMRDADGNAYVWATTSKNWQEGEIKTIKGTVKEHKLYRNIKETVLTRCVEVK